MRNYINIIEGLIGISGGIFIIMYLTGKLNYTGKKEARRIERVKKHGWLLRICSIFLFVTSVLLILESI